MFLSVSFPLTTSSSSSKQLMASIHQLHPALSCHCSCFWILATTSPASSWIPSLRHLNLPPPLSHLDIHKLFKLFLVSGLCLHANVQHNSQQCANLVLYTLSPEMSFTVIVLFRPPTAKHAFCNHLANVLKTCDAKEVLWMDDFNPNRWEKTQNRQNTNEKTWLIGFRWRKDKEIKDISKT